MLNKIKFFKDLNKELLYIIIIFFIVFFLFLYNLNVNYLYHKNIVPRGDPFSYVVSLLHLHKDLLNNFFYSFAKTLTSGQWYYAYKLPLLIFAKFIPYETYFYYIINYFYFFIFSLSFFYFLQSFGNDYKKNIIITSLVAICPFLIGFESTISLNILMLDTQFFLLSISLFVLSLSFLIQQNIYKSIFLGIVGGLFIWSRGNSIFYLFILFFFPFIFYILGISKKKIKFDLKNLIIPIAIISFFTIWYLYFCYNSLVEYYSVHASLIDSYNYNFIGFIKNFTKITSNYPGKLIFQDSVNSKNLSISINLFLLVIFFFLIFSKKIKLILNNHFNPILICILTYLLILVFLTINLSPWLEVNFYVDHATILILLPLISISALIIQFVFARIKINNLFFVITIILILFLHEKQNKNNYNKILNNYLNNNPGLVKPKELENFSINVFKDTENKKVAILFYNFYNPPILDYYRLKNSLTPASMSNENVYQVIRPIAGDPELYVSRQEYKKYLNNVLEEYDYLIMPLNFNEYSIFSHLLISKYKKETLEVFEDSKYKFIPIKILNDSIQLVLLKKIDLEEINDNSIYYPDLDDEKLSNLPDDKFLPNISNSIQELFDDNLGSFFEKHYLNKIEIEIKLKKKFKLNSYSFEFGEHYPESILRLPKNWDLKIYDLNKQEWIIVDTKNNYEFSKEDYRNFPIFKLKDIYAKKLKFVIKNKEQNHNILRIYNLKLNSNNNKTIVNDDVIKSNFKVFKK